MEPAKFYKIEYRQQDFKENLQNGFELAKILSISKFQFFKN